MEPYLVGTFGFGAVLFLLALRVPIGFTLASVATLCSLVVYAWRPGGEFHFFRGLRPALGLIESNAFQFIHSYELSMVPLFIAAGHIAYWTGITTDIFEAARAWLRRVPGGLAIASLIGCGGFSAITGSSVACASSMGKICVPQMQRLGYSDRLATSSVAVGGTLGSLIPPSVLFIIYGLFTETSISQLFLAGVIPGLLSLAGFMLTVIIWVTLNPSEAPRDETPAASFGTLIRAGLQAWPAMLLFAIILGGIYGGIFTATEAASICLAFVIVYGVVTRRLTFEQFRHSILDTVKQSAALFFIAVGAKIFVSFISLTGVTQAFVDWVTHSGFPVWVVLLAIILMYLALGMFLDSIGIMLLTLPFIVPVIESMGFNLIWFGVVVIKLLEIGLITPPVGLNVFVVSSVVGKDVRVGQIFSGVTRFLVLDLVVLILLVFFPVLSLWLPLSASG
ncbi:TRAP transporter large permease [Paracoccus sp. (in: a-proteobacteria)]|uniref:TRAP transporter large permease n=1 Tax=Paracoccus sp. TaxID=267 RepID=UPI003A8B89E7